MKLKIETVVGDNNQVTIPRAVAERHGIQAGQRIVIVDAGNHDEFIIRLLRPTCASVLAGAFGTTEENVAYARGEREAWD